MYRYYFSLAWRNFRRQPWFVVLIALILGAGTGLFITTYSLLSVLAGDPIPQKSERLLSLRLGGTTEDGEPVSMMSSDLVRVVRKTLPEIQIISTTSGFGSVASDNGDKRKLEIIRFSDASFFRIFDVPILKGRGWTEEEDAQGVPIAVIGRELAESLFETATVIGRSIVVGNARFRIIGVLDDWQPVPRYYDLSVGAYVPADQVFLPQSSVRIMDRSFFITHMCPSDQAETTPDMLAHSSCSWLNVWALVGNADQRSLVESRLDGLLQQWRLREGWSEGQGDVRVENVRELLRRKGVVPGGARFGVLLAFGFLLLCLVNAAGLLLAKCLRCTQEIGVRRALGASRGDIMQQFMVEAGMLGLAGSLAGIMFTAIGIKLTQQLPEYYMQLARFSLPMLMLALATSVFVGLAAGLFPAWRASLVEPAIQVKVD